MAPPRPPPPAVSAPGLVGPTSILNWPLGQGGPSRRRPARPYTHVRLEIDLRSGVVQPSDRSGIRRVEALLRERPVVEATDLRPTVAQLLHGLARSGFSRVDRWTLEPGGDQAVPGATDDPSQAPIGAVRKALDGAAGQPVRAARRLRLELEGSGGNRAEVVVRRLHRERRHTLSLDLRGRWAQSAVKDVVAALRERLPVARSEVTAVSYD